MISVGRLLVSGSRTINDYPAFKKIIKQYDFELLVHGAHWEGVDKLCADYAKEIRLGNREKKFPAKWTELGKSAGPNRNRAMAKFCYNENDRMLAIWDQKSKGTLDCIEAWEELYGRKRLDVWVIKK